MVLATAGPGQVNFEPVDLLSPKRKVLSFPIDCKCARFIESKTWFLASSKGGVCVHAAVVAFLSPCKP